MNRYIVTDGHEIIDHQSATVDPDDNYVIARLAEMDEIPDPAIAAAATARRWNRVDLQAAARRRGVKP